MVSDENQGKLSTDKNNDSKWDEKSKEFMDPTKCYLGKGDVISKKGLLAPTKSRTLWRKVRKYLPTFAKVVSSIILWALLILYGAVPAWPVFIIFLITKFIDQAIMFLCYHALPFDSTDSLWMQERPENLTIINALLILRGEVDISRARNLILQRMVNAKDKEGRLRYPRLQKFVFSGHLNFFWLDEGRFNIEDHVQVWDECTLTKKRQRAILSMLCSRAFPKEKSPWEIVLVPHVNKIGMKSTAVLFRVHHCIADGLSLARLLIRVLPDNEPDEIPIRKFPARYRMLLYFKGIFFGPFFLITMLCRTQSKNILNGKYPGGKKKLTWSKAMDLQIIKKIKDTTRVTVNDVLMSCCSGALRDFFIERGTKPPDSLSVALPVDLRPDNDKCAQRFKNNFAMLPFKLFTNFSNPLQLLYETKKYMDVLKSSGEPFAVCLGMRLFSFLLPHFITRPICSFACEKTTSVISNIPGPQNEIIIGGHVLEAISFWPPQRDRIGMAISMSSYNGKVFVGVEIDEALQIDPDEICKKYELQLERLAKSVGIQS